MIIKYKYFFNQTLKCYVHVCDFNDFTLTKKNAQFESSTI